jgi:hypothetical protein
VHAREQAVEVLDDSLRKLLGRIYDACIESLRLMSNSLAEQQPIPDLPDTRSLIHEVESRGKELIRSVADDEGVRTSVLHFMSATSQLRSWVNAIHDCRDKANALDWEAWNRNYF